MMNNTKVSTLIYKFGVLILTAAAVIIVVFAYNAIRQRYDDRSLQAMHPGRQDSVMTDENESENDGDITVDLNETTLYTDEDDRLADQTDLLSGRSDSSLAEDFLNETNESQNDDADPLAALKSDLTFEKNKFQDLFMKNTDFVGWIQINQTRIDYPVVKARDNIYYLDRNFDRQERRNGAIFMDYRNSGTWQDRHTIIYGHHTRDGSMFTDLLKFRRSSFYDQNRDLAIETLFGEVQYRIIAAYIAESEPSYIRTIFDEPAFDAFISEMRQRTLHAWDTDIVFGDQLLTLITCAYDFNDARMVVHAVRTSE